MSKSIRSQIKQHDFHSIMEISEDVDIQDMGDYVVIDEVFKDPDAVYEYLASFPADSTDEIKRLLYRQGDKPEFKTPNGITQLLPNQYFDVWFQDLYKLLIEAEFVPHQVNQYLKDKEYMSQLSRSGLVTCNLQHDNMVIHKRGAWPTPVLEFEYACDVFLGDDIDPENGISFYDLLFEDKRYKNVEDLTEIKDKELQGTLKDYLNVFVTVQPDLEMYKPYEDTKFYDKVRFVEAKKNRMVIFKSGKWMTHDYNGKQDVERYVFNTNIIIARGQEQGDPEARNQLEEDKQLPGVQQPQQWDSDY